MSSYRSYSSNQIYKINPNRTYVFLDISIDGSYVGTLKFELFDDICPRTSTNFRLLCTGEKKGNETFPLHFKNTKFFKVFKGKIAMGGDISRNDGRGGMSAWGVDFADENFEVKHFKAGLLSSTNRYKPDSNNSQFFITLTNTFWYDNKHVVFGEMIEGKNVLEMIEECGNEYGEVKNKVIIQDCGIISFFE